MATKYSKRRKQRLKPGDLVRYWGRDEKMWVLATIVGTWDWGRTVEGYSCHANHLGKDPRESKEDMGYLLLNSGNCDTIFHKLYFSDYTPNQFGISWGTIELIQAHK